MLPGYIDYIPYRIVFSRSSASTDYVHIVRIYLVSGSTPFDCGVHHNVEETFCSAYIHLADQLMWGYEHGEVLAVVAARMEWRKRVGIAEDARVILLLGAYFPSRFSRHSGCMVYYCTRTVGMLQLIRGTVCSDNAIRALPTKHTNSICFRDAHTI